MLQMRFRSHDPSTSRPPSEIPAPGHRRGAKTPLWVLGFVLSLGLLAVPGHAQEPPRVHAKEDAPELLRALFAEGDDALRRRGDSGLELAGRTLAPNLGVSSSLSRRQISEVEPVLAIAAWDRFPTAEQWTSWSASGLRHVEYLGNLHWLVELTAPAQGTLSRTQATTLVEFLPSDKTAPELSPVTVDSDAFDAERHLVVVEVTLLPDTAEATRRQIEETFHVAEVEYFDNSGGPLLTMVMDPASMDELAQRHEVISVQPGVFQPQMLMDGVRARAHGDVVIGNNGFPLTGSRIRVATRELLNAGKSHEGYWNHDSAGTVTTPRWTPLAANACIDGTGTSCQTEAQCRNQGRHGMMTAGIMMGNGWGSDANGADHPLRFRGIAPQATLECYYQSGAHAHLSSHSYVGYDVGWDRSIVGDSSDETYHAHTVAAGNSGLTAGYRSLANDSKNAMIVAMSQASGPITPVSSAGPTFDGRLKPDITAPSSDFPAYQHQDRSLEVESIAIRRGGDVVVRWDFDSTIANWHLGWGQAPTSLNSASMSLATNSADSITMHIEAGPWGGGWQHSPVIGTSTRPWNEPLGGGTPLDIQGQEDDVMVIRYRSLSPAGSDFGYFNIIASWFRCYPQAADCSGGIFWSGQSSRASIGIGDGTWRTLEIPVGRTTGQLWTENAYWDDEQTWAGESIQWLGLRFGKIDTQPTPSHPQGFATAATGTSAASPVVGGAYALAMEQLPKLYRRVNLDDKLALSPYWAGDSPFFIRGMPFNSTWKAIFIHTAEDMVRLNAPAQVPANPDTGIPNVYHRGPDYTTGYGLIDIQRGIDLMIDVAEAQPLHQILEQRLAAGQFHKYPITVDDLQAVSGGLAATLVWDDEPNTSGTLVNNLGLFLVDPNGQVFYPWSLEVPELPITAADIVAARQDKPNDRDNVEQVQVKGSIINQGVWSVYVVDNGMGGATQSQKYSLVISPLE